MPKKKNIAPMPTEYRGVKFRSKLEARCAVMLDNYRNVLSWQYEPRKYIHLPNNWEYTPDFEVTYFKAGKRHKILIEVKPSRPSEQYCYFLKTMANVTNPLAIIALHIDFFNTASEAALFERTNVRPFFMQKEFDNALAAFQIASAYRFDI